MNAVAAVSAVCVRHKRAVVLLCIALAVLAGIVATRRFSIDTDTNHLMPASLAWVQREHRYQTLFPPQRIVGVVQAPTPENAQDAAMRVAGALRKNPAAIEGVLLPEGNALFARAALLFRPLPDVQRTAAELERARPILAALAMDPSLRGIMGTAAQLARQRPQESARPSRLLANTIDEALNNRFASFSWQSLLQGEDPHPADLRQLLLISPKQDFTALQPAIGAETSIRNAAMRADIAGKDGANIRLTGEAAINDDQFSTLSRGAALNGTGTACAVLLILFLALRSARIVLAVAINLIAGLAITAATGLLIVGPFNLISVAFAALFVGLGADFGIQFAVRYRAERHDNDNIEAALRGAASKAGGALLLAACSVTAGFCSFVPTSYRGIAELGEVAGMGMIIAFALTITLLPALLALFRSSGEKDRLGYAFLAPVDRFLARHRYAVVGGTILVVLAGTPLLTRLKFDFDPMHLQDPNSEAVRTYRDLSRDPATGVAAVDVAAPTLAKARALARQLQALPTVQATRTIDSLIPNDQPAKIQTIAQVAPALLQALNPPNTNPPPTNAENSAAIVALANALPRGPQQDRLRELLRRLEQNNNAQARVATALTVPLRMDFARLSAMLRPEPVTQGDLPSDLRRLWLAPNSQARVQILPKGDATNTAAMAEFARQVQSVAPQASGTAITLLESRHTVIRAFIEAGAIAILSIAIILFITLRRVGDVALTLVPLLVAGAVTLEVAVLIGQDLNFANIIALPLLLGVGVAFKIYYILAWRRGATNLLQSTLTRAIFFSALTTMTAFGSLWLSQQPGMSSMGKLMALALLCTLLAAVLFQPALMGPPRNVQNPANDQNPAAPADRPTSPLDTLAERAGIEPEFCDARGDMKTTPPETKRRLLAAMGVKADTDTQAGEALAALDRSEWARALPPVVVAPAGAITIGVVQTAGATSLAWQLTLEDGSTRNGQINPATLALSASGIGDGAARERRTLVLDGIPEGYHGLRIGAEETTIIATPEKCWLPDSVRGGARLWGVAAQLYLLRSDNNWGIGDFSDLRQLIGLLAPRGADVIGLNPLHAMFLDRPEHASPYSPASRLLLNVLNIDVLAVPELATCPAAQHLIANPAFQARLHACRAAALVNYPEVARLKLEALTTIYTACRGVRQPAFESFRQNAGPMLQRGCVFQALREHLASTDPQLADWHNWPEEYRDPGSDDVAHFAAMHADRIDFRAWLQFLADQQLAAAAATARDAGMQIGLYRDLAVGADPAGAETWSNPRAVADGAQVGAPPDIHNPAGQNWGLPPFNPHALREEAYASFIELVRANMRHAGGLRIDHVMALQHLYWIPTGAKPDLGAYVRYDINALVGILALESQRHHCIVVGEDLGTVPEGFRERMAKANILSYRVLFFEQDRQGGFLPPESYPSLALSVAGSHDLPTLRGWWAASDIALKERLGLYPRPGEASRQTAQRDRDREALIAALRQAHLIGPAEIPDAETLVRAAHVFLAQTPSVLAMAQIDDITGEEDPVNVPATTDEHPNWRRRQSITLEALATQPELDRVATQFNQARKAVLF